MTNSVELTALTRKLADVFTARSMHDWTRYVKASGLSMPQFGILMNLRYRHNCGVSDISDHMEISPAAASQLVEKLVQSGLLERQEDPHDRRARRLSLSERGVKLIETGIDARSRWVEEFVTMLSPDEYDTVAAAFGALDRAISRLDLRQGEK